MNNTLYAYLIYLCVVSLITFFTFGIDKLKAKRGSFRISEKALLTLCLIGGALGGIFGMTLFHHKTKKPKFTVTLPLLSFIYIVLTVFLILN